MKHKKTLYSFKLRNDLLKKARQFCSENNVTLTALLTEILEESVMYEGDRMWRETTDKVTDLIIKHNSKLTKKGKFPKNAGIGPYCYEP